MDEGPKEPDGPAPEFIDKEVEDEARDLLADYGIDVRGAKKQKRIKSKTGATNEEEDDDIEDDAGASLPLPRLSPPPRCRPALQRQRGEEQREVSMSRAALSQAPGRSRCQQPSACLGPDAPSRCFSSSSFLANRSAEGRGGGGGG